MVAPLDARKLAEYIVDSKSYKHLRSRVHWHLELLKLEEEGKMPSSGGKD